MPEFLIEILEGDGWVSFLDRGSEVVCPNEPEAVRMLAALHQQTLGTYRALPVDDFDVD